MADIPADAPRSEDGHYWWDGAQWQLVDQSQQQAAGQQAAAAQPAAQQQPLTDDLFANMLQAATSDVVEA
jgi:peptide subunit release factor 1 (eRF1)